MLLRMFLSSRTSNVELGVSGRIGKRVWVLLVIIVRHLRSHDWSPNWRIWQSLYIDECLSRWTYQVMFLDRGTGIKTVKSGQIHLQDRTLIFGAYRSTEPLRDPAMGLGHGFHPFFFDNNHPSRVTMISLGVDAVYSFRVFNDLPMTVSTVSFDWHGLVSRGQDLTFCNRTRICLHCL